MTFRRLVDVAVWGFLVVWTARHVALMADPVEGTVGVGVSLYIGLRAGAVWRQQLRERRDTARAENRRLTGAVAVARGERDAARADADGWESEAHDQAALALAMTDPARNN